MKYTLLVVSKRKSIAPNRAPRLEPFLGIRDSLRTPELWDIVQSKECSTPKQVGEFLRNNNLFFRGLPYGDTLKVEVHEHQGRFDKVDWKIPPMVIKSIIPAGSRTYRPSVHFTNGKIQDLTKFLNDWKMKLPTAKKQTHTAVYVTD